MATLERRGNFWRVKIRRADLPAPDANLRYQDARPALGTRRRSGDGPMDHRRSAHC